ncbi:MAG TPA: hypothetical protein PK728_13140 [Bacillota bacterium]|nr:hypothetical protein [Bacillota bacterium]
MTVLKNKKAAVLAAVLLISLSAAVWVWSSGLFYVSARKPAPTEEPAGSLLSPRVTRETIVIKDKEYLCGDSEKIWEGAAPEDLFNMERRRLEEEFPASAGWVVYFTDPKFLSLTLKADEFCPIHRVYRHLGLYHGMVAVFEGPAGFNDRVLRVENIPAETLNPDLRIKLEQVMDFNRLAHETAENLRTEFEFNSDEALNAALENLDEYD